MSWRFVVGFAAMLTASSPAAALPAASWARDLAALRSAYATVHPDPFHKLEQAEFDARADALVRDLPKLDDAAVVVRMVELIASAGDGHSRLTMPLPENVGTFRGHARTEHPRIASFNHLPIRLTSAADGYVVTRTSVDERALLGAALEAIDGHPITAIEAAVLPVVHGDNSGMTRAYLPDFLIVPEVLHARAIARDPLTSTWTFRTADGRSIARRLAPLPKEGAIDWVGLGDVMRSDAPALSIERHANGIIHARVAEIFDQPGQSFRDFAGALYAAIDADPGARLVIDLGGNPGGNNGLIDPLVRGAIERHALWRPGHLFVLTDGRTFSAAQNLVNAFERWTPAVFVGEPTGAAPNSYGDAKRIVLPESGLTVRVSSLYWQDSSPQDRRDTVSPHLPTASTAADLRAGHDPALAAIEALSIPLASADGEWAAPITLGYQQSALRLTIADDGASFALADLGVPETSFSEVSRRGGAIEAAGEVGSYQIRLVATATRGGLIGRLEVAGRPYAFVAHPLSR